MTLSHLTDSALHSDLKNLVTKEKILLTEILEHIREVDSRRLYSALKFTSLFDYLVKGIGYTPSSAQRRILAARLMNKIPEIKNEIKSGKINLTQIGMIENLTKNQSIEVKKELLNEITGKDLKETEIILNTHFNLNDKKTLSLEVDAEIMDLLKQIKDLEVKNLSNTENLKLALKNYLEFKKSRKHRSVRMEVKTEIYQEAQHKCTNCGSTKNLNIDHCKPRALNGSNETSNLRLLCFHCNQRKAIEAKLIIKSTSPNLSRNFFSQTYPCHNHSTF